MDTHFPKRSGTCPVRPVPVPDNCQTAYDYRLPAGSVTRRPDQPPGPAEKSAGKLSHWYVPFFRYVRSAVRIFLRLSVEISAEFMFMAT